MMRWGVVEEGIGLGPTFQTPRISGGGRAGNLT